MARVTYGALVTEIRGSVGGTTFQRNAYGFSVKNKANMISPNTTNQNRGKLYLSRATKRWNALSSAVRNAWDAWALANPQYAKNNPTSQLSGRDVYVRRCVYELLLSFGITELTSAPTAGTDPLDVATIVLTNNVGALEVDVTWAIGTETFICLFYMSRVISDSQLFVGSSVRYVDAQTTTNVGMDFTAQYIALYGAIPAIGALVNMRYVLVGVTNGQVTAPVDTLLTIQAP